MGDGHNDMARRVAADQVVVRSAVASLASSVNELKKSQRPMADLNAYADAQEKATKVMVSLGGAAEPPMAGEDIVAYNIRLARKMQPNSPRWKGVDLNIIAADRQALDGILDQIRADATAAGLSPVGLKLGQFREVVTQSPGGHKVTNFVGSTETTGTIFKQLSRPVRHVAFIGTRTPAPHY